MSRHHRFAVIGGSVALFVALAAPVAHAAWTSPKSGGGSSRADAIATVTMGSTATCTNNADGSATVHITWSASQAFVAYQIQRKIGTGSGTSFSDLAQVTGTGSYNDTVTPQNKSFQYKISATTAGAWSGAASTNTVSYNMASNSC